MEGTFVLYRPELGARFVHAPKRAAARFVPASSFKVFNSLVLLEEGVVADLEAVVPYEGEPARRSVSRDLSLREAFRHSALWVYQKLARRLEPAAMRRHLESAGYGNAETGSRIDRFWVEGPLEISALEQVEFLDRLRRRALAFSPRTLDLVHELMVVEAHAEPRATLRAKTGWGRPGDGSQTGWYVGWAEGEAGVGVFALNIAIAESEDARAREAITRAILRAEGLLP